MSRYLPLVRQHNEQYFEEHMEESSGAAPDHVTHAHQTRPG